MQTVLIEMADRQKFVVVEADGIEYGSADDEVVSTDDKLADIHSVRAAIETHKPLEVRDTVTSAVQGSQTRVYGLTYPRWINPDRVAGIYYTDVKVAT